MLVLSRKQNESIVIADDIVVTVLGVRGDQVRLGITAPGHVPVLREELVVSVAEANKAAVAGERLLDVTELPRSGS